MIVIRLGCWNHHCTRHFIFKRIWWRGYRWTPFCRMKHRWVREPNGPEGEGDE